MRHYSSLFQLHASGLVKVPQVVLLAALTKDGTGVPFNEITLRAGISASHASTAVDALAKARMLEKRYPLRDGRTVTVYLTPDGVRRASEMLRALDAFYTNQKVAEAAQTAEK